MILGVYGYPNSGKTTLVVKLVGHLVGKGYRVATVKHICEPGFTIDEAGTDTYRHGKAGAALVVAVAGSETAFISRRKAELEDILLSIKALGAFDVILVEGFKGSSLPKVKVGKIRSGPNTVFVYGSEKDLGKLTGYIEDRLGIERIRAGLPGLDCHRCGSDCDGFAARVFGKKTRIGACHHYSKKRIFVRLNGRDIPMGRFAKDIVFSTVLGLCSSLKGTEGAKTAGRTRIEISITAGNS